MIQPDEKTLKKPSVIIIYHANCIDGFTAAWAVTKGLNPIKSDFLDIRLIPYQHGQDTTQLLFLAKQYSLMYIVDFSFSLDILQQLSEYIKIILLDHHRTAFQEIASKNPEDCENEIYKQDSNNLQILLNNNQSGARIAWDRFFPHHSITQPTPKLIQYVSDYDLWKHNMEDSKAIHLYLTLAEPTLKLWDNYAKAFEVPSMFKVIRERAITAYEYHSKLVAEIVEQAQSIVINEDEGLYVYTTYSFISDVGSKLARKSKTFGAIVIQEDKRHKISLRSYGDYDVAAIAKKYGGGGHKDAASFHVNFINFDYEGIKINFVNTGV